MAKIYIDSIPELVKKAGDIRKGLIGGAHRIGGVHIGGPLSAVDPAVAIYYKYLGMDPDNIEDPDRNYFILSKGHCGILLYTIFCDMGIYGWDELYDGYNTVDGKFGAHPNHKTVKGIEVSSGSLGHGLSWAAGIATANRNEGRSSKVYVLLGDGEMEEGSNWEAILYIASKKLDSVVAVVDNNHCSASWKFGENLVWGENNSMADCWRAFGWNVLEVDGSNMKKLDEALGSIPPVNFDHPGKPTVIISNTIKGQGVDYMEAAPAAWHICALDDKLYEETIEKIDKYTEEKLREV